MILLAPFLCRVAALEGMRTAGSRGRPEYWIRKCHPALSETEGSA